MLNISDDSDDDLGLHPVLFDIADGRDRRDGPVNIFLDAVDVVPPEDNLDYESSLDGDGSDQEGILIVPENGGNQNQLDESLTSGDNDNIGRESLTLPDSIPSDIASINDPLVDTIPPDGGSSLVYETGDESVIGQPGQGPCFRKLRVYATILAIVATIGNNIYLQKYAVQNQNTIEKLRNEIKIRDNRIYDLEIVIKNLEDSTLKDREHISSLERKLERVRGTTKRSGGKFDWEKEAGEEFHGSNDSSYTILDNCWLRKKADIHLGECANHAYERTKEQARKFGDTVWQMQDEAKARFHEAFDYHSKDTKSTRNNGSSSETDQTAKHRKGFDFRSVIKPVAAAAVPVVAYLSLSALTSDDNDALQGVFDWMEDKFRDATDSLKRMT